MKFIIFRVKKWQIEAQRKIADSDAKLNEKLESVRNFDGYLSHSQILNFTFSNFRFSKRLYRAFPDKILNSDSESGF